MTETITLTPPGKAPLLTSLADACHSGACNVGGLLRSVSGIAVELPHGEHRSHPAVKIILGQLSYLCGESLGPTPEALAAFEEWRRQ